jgi:hypothetical protein
VIDDGAPCVRTVDGTSISDPGSLSRLLHLFLGVCIAFSWFIT